MTLWTTNCNQSVTESLVAVVPNLKEVPLCVPWFITFTRIGSPNWWMTQDQNAYDPQLRLQRHKKKHLMQMLARRDYYWAPLRLQNLDGFRSGLILQGCINFKARYIFFYLSTLFPTWRWEKGHVAQITFVGSEPLTCKLLDILPVHFVYIQYVHSL